MKKPKKHWETDGNANIDTDEQDFIKIDDVRLRPEEATCGDTVDLSFDVVNVGDEDIEDRFRVNLESTELGISTTQDIRKDLDEGDTERVSFVFSIPQDIENKPYNLKITTEHEYKERTAEFKVLSDEEKNVPLRI